MSARENESTSMPRREFLKASVAGAGALGAGAGSMGAAEAAEGAARQRTGQQRGGTPMREYNGVYTGEYLNRIAFPLGGIGAGMICLEGTGALSHVSLRHRMEVFNEPTIFAAVCVKGQRNVARVLEGPVPEWKAFGQAGTGNGAHGKTYGLPRMSHASFRTRFPAGIIELEDPKVPLHVEITGWSPFIPSNPDDSSLPVAALEYKFRNPSDKPVEAVFSFHARNFMAIPKARQSVREAPGGFVLHEEGSADKPWEKGSFCVTVGDPDAKVNHAWFRGGWFDSLTMAWKEVEEGHAIERPPVGEEAPAPGGGLSVPFRVGPRGEKTIAVRCSWYVPQSELRAGPAPQSLPEGQTSLPAYQPWYSSKFKDILEVDAFWRENYDRLRKESQAFSDCFYDQTLPPEVIEAVAANLTILKSPTVLRQADGRLWAWEGCSDNSGCCAGSCTHVWNYAQALPHLFPSLERTLRETEFKFNQNQDGHQAFRATLPIWYPPHDFHAAADGQLGGIMKAHREWRVSGDTAWLKAIWPRIRQSLEYCSKVWDPEGKGILEEPHHNTYDIEFWGPDGMCTSFYLGALAAAIEMGTALGDNVERYREILERGRKYMESELFDGEYFIQKVQWEGLKAGDPTKVQTFQGGYSPEALELLKKEGPKYQYGKGCLSDGVLGAWIAAACGVPGFLDGKKLASHLKAVHKHNLRHDLSDHANPQRPSYALGTEGGLLLCSWPKGGELSLPFVYSNEVWTGIEYQVASHLMMTGQVEEGLDIVRVARDRYDGRIRNPFNEYECGHWYARAMSSYGLIQGLTGVRYDAVTKVLHLEPRISGDFRSFLSTATGFGTVGVKDGKAFIEVKHGKIEHTRIDYRPASSGA